MIIDGHAHLGGEYKDLPTTILTLDQLGIDKVILCPADHTRRKSIRVPGLATRLPDTELNFMVNRLIRAATPERKHQKNIDDGNKRVFALSESSGGRIIQFLWVNPLKEGMQDEVETRCKEWKFRGIKLHQACHPFKIDSTPFHQIAEMAAEKNLPVFVHLYSGKEILDFIAVSGTYKTTFIVGHLIGLELFIDHKEKVSDNICFDISCPALVSTDRIRKAIKAFGPERVIMGSDAPFGKNNPSVVLSRIRDLNLRDDERDMILGKNLKHILMI